MTHPLNPGDEARETASARRKTPEYLRSYLESCAEILEEGGTLNTLHAKKLRAAAALFATLPPVEEAAAVLGGTVAIVREFQRKARETATEMSPQQLNDLTLWCDRICAALTASEAVGTVPREAETISAAANIHKGVVYSVPRPGRHGNVVRMLSDIGLCSPTDPVVDEGGFLTNTGRYVDRKEAWLIAEAAGQLLPRAPTDGRGGVLYSEDVW